MQKNIFANCFFKKKNIFLISWICGQEILLQTFSNDDMRCNALLWLISDGYVVDMLCFFCAKFCAKKKLFVNEVRKARVAKKGPNFLNGIL